MIALKRVAALVLCCVFLLSMVGAQANAASLKSANPNAPGQNDLDRLRRVQETNQKIDEYLQNKISPCSSSSNYLSVPLYRQETTYYCGPASAKMVISYVTGTAYAQSTLASSMGTNSDVGTYVYKMESELNKRIGSGSYEYVSTSEYYFSSSLVYSIDKGKPIICHVMTGGLPNYNQKSDTGHYIVATGYYIAFSGSSYRSDCNYNDPHYKDEFFGRYVCSIDEMNDAINDNYGYYIRGTR